MAYFHDSADVFTQLSTLNTYTGYIQDAAPKAMPVGTPSTATFALPSPRANMMLYYRMDAFQVGYYPLCWPTAPAACTDFRRPVWFSGLPATVPQEDMAAGMNQQMSSQNSSGCDLEEKEH